MVTSNAPPIQCNTPADVKTDEAGNAGASPVSDINLCTIRQVGRPLSAKQLFVGSIPTWCSNLWAGSLIWQNATTVLGKKHMLSIGELEEISMK